MVEDLLGDRSWDRREYLCSLGLSEIGQVTVASGRMGEMMACGRNSSHSNIGWMHHWYSLHIDKVPTYQASICTGTSAR